MIDRLIGPLRRWGERHWVEFFAGSAISLLLLVVLWPLIVYNIPAGHVGVLWLRFMGGTVVNRTLGEGIHFIFPWDKIYIYDARLQRFEETVKGLTVDGLDITVRVVCRYIIDAAHVGYLHKSLGPSYVNTLLRPQLRTTVLTYISNNEAEDLYELDRQKLQAGIERDFNEAIANTVTNTEFGGQYVKLQNVLIEEIRLPDYVERAIQEKERVRHIAESYKYRLDLANKERERKRIEAEGIRTFQEIVSPGITESYLRWRGIEATLKLATSPNAKIVIIGGGKDGLPIILNTEGNPVKMARGEPGANSKAAGAANGVSPPAAAGTEATPMAPLGSSDEFFPVTPEEGGPAKPTPPSHAAAPGPRSDGAAPGAAASAEAAASPPASRQDMLQRLYDALTNVKTNESSPNRELLKRIYDAVTRGARQQQGQAAAPAH